MLSKARVLWSVAHEVSKAFRCLLHSPAYGPDRLETHPALMHCVRRDLSSMVMVLNGVLSHCDGVETWAFPITTSSRSEDFVRSVLVDVTGHPCS